MADSAYINLRLAALHAVLAFNEHEIIMESGHGHDAVKLRKAMEELRAQLSAAPAQVTSLAAAGATTAAAAVGSGLGGALA